MCGITGFWDFRRISTEADLLTMTDCLAHRGPDDSGTWISQADGIGLGHRRLAIIDLSTRGRQPMSNNDQSVWIVFNGEIYNYKDIRIELVSKGYRFTTNSDTEVIIKAYEAWGIESISRLRGMFAFALLDTSRRVLYLVRDRLGVKPLYYYYDGKLLLFASQLKALMAYPSYRKDIDHTALTLYLQLGYVPYPMTIFTNTYKVQPGCYVKVSADGGLMEAHYWELADFCIEPFAQMKSTQVEEKLRVMLSEAFAYRMVSDVPVGIFLSGGIDSSLVTAVLARETNEKLRTFTVGFQDIDQDESLWANEIAQQLGTEHTTLLCTEREALDIVPRLPEIYDEPFGDSSAIPTYFLCKAVREHVKVVLSGDGGDEFFCGYNHYTKFDPIWNKLSSIPVPLKGSISAMLRSIPVGALEMISVGLFSRLFPHINVLDFRDKILKSPDLLEADNLIEAYSHIKSKWPIRELSSLAPDLRPSNPFDGVPKIDRDPMTVMMLIDAMTFLPSDYLVKVDRASMAVGLEVREPMLDHKLVEYACSLPLRYKYFQGTTKYILRKILYKYLPQRLVDRPKHGFSVPLGKWLRGPLKPVVRNYLNEARIREEGIFSSKFVQETVDNFLAGARIHPKKIWSLLMFELWYERWLRS